MPPTTCHEVSLSFITCGRTRSQSLDEYVAVPRLTELLFVPTKRYTRPELSTLTVSPLWSVFVPELVV